MESRVVRCGNCKAELAEAGSEEPAARKPCPQCGSTSRVVDQHLAAKVNVRSVLSLNARPPKGKPFMLQKLGASFFQRTRRWHRLHRVIDRRGNRYYERIEDEETGELVQPVVDEPLTDHQGHGDARRKES